MLIIIAKAVGFVNRFLQKNQKVFSARSMGTGVGPMPRRKQPLKRRTFIKFYVSATLVLAALALGQFSRYVNTTVKPTLHQLAEYEARAATVRAMQSAVSAQLQTMPTLCEALYIQRGELVQLDTARANAAEVQLTCLLYTSPSPRD